MAAPHPALEALDRGDVRWFTGDRRAGSEAWHEALTLVYAALHVEARYTLPARPPLLLLGAAALAGGRKPASSGPAPDTIES